MTFRRPLQIVAIALTLIPDLAMARATAVAAGSRTLVGPLAQALTGTHRHLDVMLPGLDDPTLNRTFLHLARRGLRLRLLISERAATDACAPCRQLAAAGAEIRYPDLAIDSVFAVVDGPRGRQDRGDGSRVLVATGGLRARGDAVLIGLAQEGDYAVAYQAEFNAVWNHSRSFTPAQDLTAGKTRRAAIVAGVVTPPSTWVRFTSATLTPIRMPDGWTYTRTLDSGTTGITTELAGAIDQAYEQVDIAAHGLRSPEVRHALRRALDRGVKVRLLLSGSGQTAVAGARIAHIRGRRIQTNLVLIDGKTAMTGGFRWRDGAGARRLGNLVILNRESGGVAALATLFERQWRQAAPAVRAGS